MGSRLVQTWGGYRSGRGLAVWRHVGLSCVAFSRRSSVCLWCASFSGLILPLYRLGDIDRTGGVGRRYGVGIHPEKIALPIVDHPPPACRVGIDYNLEIRLAPFPTPGVMQEWKKCRHLLGWIELIDASSDDGLIVYEGQVADPSHDPDRDK